MITMPAAAAECVAWSKMVFNARPSAVVVLTRGPSESEMMLACWAIASLIPCSSHEASPEAWPAIQPVGSAVEVVAEGRRSMTLMFSREADGATPATRPVWAPRAPAASEAVQVPWPC